MTCLRFFIIDEKKEQRTCIKFCFNLGKSATETYGIIRQAFSEQSMSRSQVFEWYARFKSGRKSTEDDERSGRPPTSTTTENITKIQQIIQKDPRQTIHDVADELGIGYGMCEKLDAASRQCTASHSALVTRTFLAKNSTTVVLQPPYSPDLAPCDFGLFPKLKI